MLLPQLLSLDSPALGAAAATGSGTVQMAAWVDAERLLLVVCIGSSSSALLVELAVDGGAGAAREMAAVSSGVPRLLACCSRPPPGSGVLLQQHGGTLLAYSAGGLLQPLPAAASFPCGCSQMVAVPAEAAAPADGAPAAKSAAAAFGLSSRGQLYLGARQLATGVTSFAVRAPASGWP